MSKKPLPIPLVSSEDNELAGFLHGQGAKQDGVEKAEDRGIGADAEGQRDQRHDGERRAAEHGSQAVMDIPQKALEDLPIPMSYGFSPGCGWCFRI